MSDCLTHPVGLTHSNGSSERPHAKCNDDMSLLPASLKLSFGIALRINLTLQSHFIIDIIQHLSSWTSNFLIRVAAAAKSLQSCLTLCDPIDGSPPGSPHPWDSHAFPFQCMKVKSEREVAQSCPTLSNPMDCSLPGSSIHGILQARVLEWVAIAFSVLSGLDLHNLVVLKVQFDSESLSYLKNMMQDFKAALKEKLQKYCYSLQIA